MSGTGDDVPVRWEPDPDRPVLRVTLDRPAKLNALNDAIRVGLQRAADELAERDEIRVVVLGARGDRSRPAPTSASRSRPRPTRSRLGGSAVAGNACSGPGAGELDTAVEALVDELVAQPALALALTVDGLRALGRATSALDTAWADADLLRWSLRDGRR